MPTTTDRGLSSPATAAARPRDQESARQLAYWLDDLIRIPGTNIRVGLDALLGLVPGAGDVATSAMSLVILARAVRLEVPGVVLGRMAGNIALDAVIGAVPGIGDIADVAFRANRRNARLLEKYMTAPAGTARASRATVIGVLAVGVLALGLSIAIGIVVVTTLIRWVAGLF